MRRPSTIIVQLLCIEGPLKGHIHEFSDAEIRIGRTASCHLRFPGNLLIVSREHATIVREGSRFRLLDKSRNGTFVNGKRIKEVYLKDGDVITFAEGGPKFSFLTKMRDASFEPPLGKREGTPAGPEREFDVIRETLEPSTEVMAQEVPAPQRRQERQRPAHVTLQRSAEPEEVHIGAAVPDRVCPGDEFVARFAAYTEAHRSEVLGVISQEAPLAYPRLDLETCRWSPGAKVTVRLQAHHVEISNPVQTFKWNGAWCILRFDARISGDIGVDTIILKFDVAVEGFPILAIRPEIVVTRSEKDSTKTNSVSIIERPSPRSAFASYAKQDRRDVLGRVRSLQIFTGIDIFLDCLSIRPSEDWKLKVKNEIYKRDIFWLFWSRSAMASKWVEWEWRTALAEKSLTEIQPHPLEPAELAPPPHELSGLQFGGMYEYYVSQLRESIIAGVFRRLLHKVSSLRTFCRRHLV